MYYNAPYVHTHASTPVLRHEDYYLPRGLEQLQRVVTEAPYVAVLLVLAVCAIVYFQKGKS